MAIHEVRVVPIHGDPLGDEVLRETERTLGIAGIDAIATATVYRLEGVTKAKAQQLAKSLLADPVAERFVVDEAISYGEAVVIEVAYKPGVMNPAVASVHKAAEALGIRLAAADVSTEYAFSGPGATQKALGASASEAGWW